LSDDRGDDHGDNGNFTYPLNPQFSQGVADIISFEISQYEKDYLFTFEFDDLVDPGWHPEYGYQLTFGALGISFSSGTGTTTLSRNAKASFQSGFRADQIIYFSSGLIITDHKNQPIAEYLPTERKGALGNAETDKVQFIIPSDIFPVSLAGAKFQLAVGCQDDHGGAVIGDFREVEEKSAEWIGGGASPGSSNVYDWLKLEEG
jgi:carbohydrate-binding DOMON domain-containing protein